MTFRDEAERQAWSSAWDAGIAGGQYGPRKGVSLDEIADAKIEAMRERGLTVEKAWNEISDTYTEAWVKKLDSEFAPKPPTAAEIYGIMSRPAPDTATQPSERPALERVRRMAVYRTIRVKYLNDTALEAVCLRDLLAWIDAELAKQPEPELPPKVKAVIEAARQGLTALMLGSGHENLYRHACEDLAAALKALDEGGAK